MTDLAKYSSLALTRRGFLQGSIAFVGTSVAAWGQAAAPAAPTKVRSVLIVPYATTDLLRDEQWLGEAAAQSVKGISSPSSRRIKSMCLI